jgi:very-short-patch-repair endonuclease
MLKNIAPNAGGGAVTRARRNRREMSLPEVLLWRELKGRPCGIKFRRQHPSGPYVLDFFCNDARLAIEIDGISHAMGDRPQRDALRDAFFARAGMETVRIPASVVLADPVAVATSIVAFARNRLPLHHPAMPDGPPPRDKLGED